MDGKEEDDDPVSQLRVPSGPAITCQKDNLNLNVVRGTRSLVCL